MILSKLNTFLMQNTKTKLLLIEAFLFLGCARILKMIPFSKVAPFLGDHMNETSYDYQPPKAKKKLSKFPILSKL